jgi:hypothetical protein
MARRIRPALLPLVAVVGAFALVPCAAASGAITASHIDLPADPLYTFYGFNAASGTGTNVAGTATGTGNVDVLCYRGDSPVPVPMKSGVPVDAEGNFSTTVDATASLFPCFLRAVPAGTTPSDPSAFTGPRIAGTDHDDTVLSGGPNDGRRVDYAYSVFGTRGVFYVYSSGAGGIADSNLIDPSNLHPAANLLASNVFGLYDADYGEQAATRSEIEVDGASAYGPYSAASNLPGANTPGVPSITIMSESFDPDTGAVRSTTREPIVKCSPQTDFASNHTSYNTSCTQYVSTGVVLDRTILSGGDGRTLRVKDTWRSTNGQPHSIDALYDSRFGGNFNGAMYLPTSGFRFPGSSTFQDYAYLETVPLPSGPGTFYFKTDRASPDSGDAQPQGAVSWSVAPDQLKFIGSDEDGFPPDWTMRYARTVPAGGAVSFTFQLAQAPGLADLETFGRAFESEFALPTSSPGTGQPAGPAGPAGEGNPAPLPADASLKRGGKPSTRWVGSRILVDTGQIGSCSAGPGSCSFALVATIPSTAVTSAATKKPKRVVIGKVTIKVAAGRSAKLTFKLSKRWTKLLVRKRHLKVGIAVTSKSQAHAATASTRSITIKAPKRPKKR